MTKILILPMDHKLLSRPNSDALRHVDIRAMPSSQNPRTWRQLESILQAKKWLKHVKKTLEKHQTSHDLLSELTSSKGEIVRM